MSAKAMKQFRFLTPNGTIRNDVNVNVNLFNKARHMSVAAYLKVSVTRLRDDFDFSRKSHRKARRDLNLKMAQLAASASRNFCA